MSDRDITPLPTDIRDLIAADRRADGIPEDARRRLYMKVGTAVVAGGAGVAIGAGAAKAGWLSALSALFSRKATIAATAFLVGGATGVSGYAVATNATRANLQTPAPVCPSAPATTPGPVPPPALPVAPVPSVSVTPVVSAAPVLPSTSPSPSPSLASDVALAKENLLMQTIKSADLRGEHGKALEACDRHRQLFPGGQLSQERELIAIKSLIGLGRKDEARTRAAAFKAAYPNSFYNASIEAMLGTP